MPQEKMDRDLTEVEKKERVVLVDDLTDTGDYWLSITDAARVTRRQEITIRRWITAGTLPVRRLRMGANKRTRHVRASDLKTLTPIIDPLAAITGAPANADLMSIPLQQAHLLTKQHDFAQRLDQTEHSLAELISHQEQARQTHELQQHQALDSLRQEILALLRVLEANVVQQHDEISRKIQEKQHAAERDAQELSHQLAQETEIRTGIEQELQTTMTTLAAQMSQIGRSIEQVRAHVEQAQVERDRQREETEARWHRQQQEGLDQLRTQMTADLQQFVTSVSLQWHQHREELSLHYAALQRHLTDVEQRCGHAEGELVRLRRQQRLARRYRRAAST